MHKKGSKMKKLFATALLALLIMALLISCGGKGGSATPGDLKTSEKPTPHVSTGEEDVSNAYFRRLCTDLWLDTNSMHICSLNDDGTYYWLQGKREQEQIATGKWTLTKDDQGFLSLYMTDDQSSDTLVLREIELYDASIYALDDEGNGIVWLTTDLPE